MVELKTVSFRYGSDERQEYGENSLSSVNLTIQYGEFVLLTGSLRFIRVKSIKKLSAGLR